MPEPSTLLLFAAGAVILVLIPGPNLICRAQAPGSAGGVYLALAALAAATGGRRA